MRLLHVASEYPPQKVFGLGRYVSDLSEELAAQGHEVRVLTNSIAGRDADVVQSGVHVHRVDFPPPPKPPGAVAPVMAFNLQLQKLSHRLGRKELGEPEAIVSHDWLTALAGHRISRRWSVPHVWTVHDLVHGKTFGRLQEPGDRSISDLESWAAGAADLILANSQAIFRELVEVYKADPARIRLLPCAIHAERLLSKQASSRLKAFRLVFAGPEELLITYVGRLDLEKGIDTLINAFCRVHKEVPKTRLAIVGTGVLEETIRRHIDQLRLQDSVALYGYLRGETLRGFYAVSDVHVCPSHYEPFGLVAAEAMAAGTAVVVSDAGGLAEIITSDDIGRRVPARNVDALARALLELARDPALRARVAQQGQTHVREHFAWAEAARKAVQFYGEANCGSGDKARTRQ